MSSIDIWELPTKKGRENSLATFFSKNRLVY